ncbi:MAG TPA: choline ABC transporter permease subunit, partial [Gemmobacter sp.]|nr:choline ABC transporter permease subunit [Gemmobacter sp.]
MLDWLTDSKLPLGKMSKLAFDWMKVNLKPLFDAMGAVMEALIDAILWVLQSPHPLVIIAVFLALTWYLQRSWKTVLFVAVSFGFILNQGYWEETTESLTLVLSSCVVCMGIGVPIGIWAAHRPKTFAAMTPV